MYIYIYVCVYMPGVQVAWRIKITHDAHGVRRRPDPALKEFTSDIRLPEEAAGYCSAVWSDGHQWEVAALTGAQKKAAMEVKEIYLKREAHQCFYQTLTWGGTQTRNDTDS